MKFVAAGVVFCVLTVSMAAAPPSKPATTKAPATQAAASQPAWLSDNLLAEPGMERISSRNKMPENWEIRAIGTPAEIVSDSAEKHSGKHSVRITATQSARSYILSESIPVAAGERVYAGAWMKVKDVPAEPGTAIVIANWYAADGSGDEVAKFDVAKLKGPESEGWQKVAGLLKVPAGVAFMRLRIGFSYSKGTLWVDDAFVQAETRVAARSDIVGTRMTPAAPTIPVSILNRTGDKGNVQVRVNLDKQQAAIEVPLSGAAIQNVNVPMRIAERGKAKMDVTLLRAGTKTVMAQETRNVVVAPALAMSPPIPTHWAIEDGPPKIAGDIDLEVPEYLRQGGKLDVTLVDAAGKTHAHWTEPAVTGWKMFNLAASSALPEGTYKVIGQFTPAKGKAVRVEQNFGVIPRRLARVTINSDGYPVYDGKAVFPMGIFNGGKFPEQGKAGFTVTHAYNATRVYTGERPNDDTALNFLENSAKHGMKAVFMVPLRFAYNGDWEGFRRRIRMFKNHPALLAWDEEESIARGDATLEVVAKMREICREEDPHHPFMIGDAHAQIGQVADRGNLFPVDLMDMGMWWWYPIPLGPKPGSALEGEDAVKGYEMAPPTFLTRTKTKKPIWVGVQSYRKGTPPRFPTPLEYRSQAYIAVIHGAKGLMWYGGSVTNGMFALTKNGKQSDDDQGTPNDKEAHWDYVQTLATELRGLSDVFMAPSEQPPTFAPADALVSVAIRRAPGRTVMLAANRNNKPVDVTFASPLIRAGSISVLAENRTVSATAGQIKDHFEPYAVHVYTLP